MARVLSTLDKKLFRDLWRIKGQALAIAFVIAAGIALLVMSRGMSISLDETMRAYYERYRFADVYAPVKRAPRHLVSDIRALEGVADANWRINGGGLVELPEVDAPITAQVISYDPNAPTPINALYLAEGRMFDPAQADEILLLAPFAEAHGLGPGDKLSITMYGARHDFKIAGLVLSPEYIYAIPPGEFVSDAASYAVIWAGEETLEAAFDLDGAFNEAILTVSRGANVQSLLDELDRLLAPYGAIGAYAREDQISNKYLVQELAGLDEMGKIMTPIFLGVAIFLLNIVVTRLVQTEREEIGIMKAFGYTNRDVGAHYLKFVVIIAIAGAFIGWLGGLWFGKVISGVYQIYFHFPFLVFVPEFRTLGISLTISTAAAALGAFFAVRSAVTLSPAVAMRPPAPPKFKRGNLIAQKIAHYLDQPSRMILRRIARQPVRAMLTTLGIAAAMALSVMMRFNLSATDYMLDVSFNVVDRSDVFVTFVEPQSETALFDLTHIEGVTYVEPFRSSPVLFTNKRIEHLGAITGLPEHPVLNRAVDKNLREVEIRGNGIVVSEQLAKTLDINIGDILSVEVRDGRRPQLEIPVTGIIEALVGTPAYMNMDALNALLKEPRRASGAYLKIDPLKRAIAYNELKAFPKIAGVSLRRQSYEKFEEMIDEGTGTFRNIMMLFSIIIAGGVIYNGARIAYIERQHDLASLRVMGFTKIETGYVLLGELTLLALIALPIGSTMGFMMWSYLAGALSTDLYQIPVVFNEEGFGFAAIVILLSTAAASTFIQRDVAKIDLASALKTRE